MATSVLPWSLVCLALTQLTLYKDDLLDSSNPPAGAPEHLGPEVPATRPSNNSLYEFLFGWLWLLSATSLRQGPRVSGPPGPYDAVHGTIKSCSWEQPLKGEEITAS